MDYMTMSWEERQRMVKEFERRIEARRNRAVSGAELTNRTMDAALHGAPVEALELERATGEGMPEPYELAGNDGRGAEFYGPGAQRVKWTNGAPAVWGVR